MGRYIAAGSVCTIPNVLYNLSSNGIICFSAEGRNTAFLTQIGEVYTLWDGDMIILRPLNRHLEVFGVTAKQVGCGGSHTAICTEDGHIYTVFNMEYLGN